MTSRLRNAGSKACHGVPSIRTGETSASSLKPSPSTSRPNPTKTLESRTQFRILGGVWAPLRRFLRWFQARALKCFLGSPR